MDGYIEQVHVPTTQLSSANSVPHHHNQSKMCSFIKPLKMDLLRSLLLLRSGVILPWVHVSDM